MNWSIPPRAVGIERTNEGSAAAAQDSLFGFPQSSCCNAQTNECHPPPSSPYTIKDLEKRAEMFGDTLRMALRTATWWSDELQAKKRAVRAAFPRTRNMTRR